MADEVEGQGEDLVPYGERRKDSFLRDILDNLDQYAFGIITQHGYRELENKLNKHAEEIEARFHRWFVRGLIAFVIMAVCCSISIVGFGVVLGKQSNILEEFKQTRKAFVQDSCEAQNRRHDDTIHLLLKAYKKASKRATSQAERMRIKNSTEVSIGLIDALAPKQDCVKLAEVSVGDAEPPPPAVPTPRHLR